MTKGDLSVVSIRVNNKGTVEKRQLLGEAYCLETRRLSLAVSYRFRLNDAHFESC